MRKPIWITAILLVLLAACGPTPTPVSQATDTAESVATPAAMVSTPSPTASRVRASPILTTTATPAPSLPSSTAPPRPSASPSASTPTLTSLPSPPPTPSSTAAPVRLSPPMVVDSETERLYVSARAGDSSGIAALSAVDGALLRIYPASGPFAVDPANGWLCVDQGEDGLIVFDTDLGAVLATIPLPKAVQGGGSQPAPQTHPSTRQASAFRDNIIYVIDLAKGEIVDSIATSVRLYNSDILPIVGSVYDSDRSLLYLVYHYSPAFRYHYSAVVSYDMTTETEIGRQEFPQTDPSDLEAVAAEGALYGQAGQWFAGPEGSASFWTWQKGEPRFLSQDWLSGVWPGIQLDVPRQRLYAATDESLLVVDMGTLALSFVVSRPAEGRLVGYDPGTDQLYFLSEEGSLQIRPSAQALKAPSAESLSQARPPGHPVRALAAASSGTQEVILAGIWQASAAPEAAMVLGRSGGLPFLGQDGDDVGAWRQPHGGLRGEAGLFTALAVSPAYATDQTLLAGVLGLGIFRSTDGGRLWQPSSVGLGTMGVDQVLLSPGFAADGTAFALASYRPLYRSTDGGRTWQVLPLEAYRLGLSPEFDGDRTLLAAAGPHPYRELHLSRDGGDTWQQVGKAPNTSPLTALSLAPLFARWQVAFVYEEEGRLYRSADGGQSWSLVLESGLAPSDARLVYAPDVEANRPVFLLVAPRYNPTYNTASGYIPPKPPTWPGRLYQSSDGGQTWAEAVLPAGLSPTALALSPHFAQDRCLYLGTADGRVVALDAAELVAQP